jgi:hypothetical protein
MHSTPPGERLLLFFACLEITRLSKLPARVNTYRADERDSAKVRRPQC